MRERSASTSAVRSRDSVYTPRHAFLPVFSPEVGMGADGEAQAVQQDHRRPPIGTGAHLVARTYNGRRIDLVRDLELLGARRRRAARLLQLRQDRLPLLRRQLRPVRKPSRPATSTSSGKPTSKRWGRQYKGDKFGLGKIVLEALPTGQGTYPRALILNVRRPKFRDARVREALQLPFDFEWLNAQNFNLFARVDSAFSNSEFAASGLPSAGELAILEPFRSRLPAAVFGPPYANPRTDTSPMAAARELKRARDLLAEAGWRPGADRILRNDRGEPFTLEVLNNDPDIGADPSPGWSTSRVSASTPASGRSTSRCSTSASTSSTST